MGAALCSHVIGGKRSLDYLWFGIGAFLRQHSDVRYLFGPVSISASYPAAARDMLVYYYSHYFASPQHAAIARLPYRLDAETAQQMGEVFKGDDKKADYAMLKSRLRHLGCNVPTLFKQYSELCEAGGVVFFDFNIDPEFADCVDGLVMLDVEKLKNSKRSRYIDNQR